ncbi:MAG: DM13 domain-containing protein [Chloroflexi bacterium]|nr:DM13 domain-containing protein [Chloroflexota bacterium]MCY3581724.1 DM13 domain-containing protein [Chloroflexota bacterium]MCY3716302.1 DM13 domain-containing protein [Chloroflexota bacterium]MDE2651329.1 DM13 domain-containing protein [Chloroflexota bacterium]MXX49448.1 DM13 domain-containing protein [Chloroflexota bacterium]
MSRRWMAIGLAALLVVALAITQPWLYFVNREVDEAFPSLSTAQRDSIDVMPEAQKQMLLDMAQDNREMAEQTALAQMEAGSVVPDAEQAMPPDMPAEPVEIASGAFIHIDPIHGADGFAKVYALPDGRQFLRFEQFVSKNGPDLHVYLSAEYPTTTFAGLGEEPLHLGALKGNIGSQNYEIPAGADLAQYSSVVIYCKPFRVVFSSAALSSS